MVWGAVAGAVGNLVGGRRDNMFNKKEADRARDWSKDMANSEIQRRVIDMKLAGINPMLAATDGASTPNAAVSAPSVSGGRLGDDAMGAYFSAKQLQMMKNKNDAEIAQIQATTAKTAAEAALIQAEVPYAGKTAFFKNESLFSQMHVLASQVSSARSESEVKSLMPEFQRLMNQAAALDIPQKEAEAKFFSQIGEGSRWADLVKNLLIGIRQVR